MESEEIEKMKQFVALLTKSGLGFMLSGINESYRNVTAGILQG